MGGCFSSPSTERHISSVKKSFSRISFRKKEKERGSVNKRHSFAAKNVADVKLTFNAEFEELKSFKDLFEKADTCRVVLVYFKDISHTLNDGGLGFHLASFVAEALDFKKLWEVSQKNKGLGAHAQDIYDKYIRHGARFQVSLSGEVWEKLVESLGSEDQKPDIFQVAAEYCIERLDLDYLEKFSLSNAYKKVLLDKASSKLDELRDAQEHGDDKAKFEEILSANGTASLFREMLEKRKSPEHFDFWQEVHDFKCFPPSKYKTEMGRKIYDKYVRVGSLEEINISSKMRGEIRNKIHSMPSDIFSEAQAQVFDLMLKNFFKEFLKYRGYEEYAEEKEEHDMQERAAMKRIVKNAPPFDEIFGGLGAQFSTYTLSDIGADFVNDYSFIGEVNKYKTFVAPPKKSKRRMSLLKVNAYSDKIASRIYEKFIRLGCRNPIRLDDDNIATIRACIVNPSPTIFEDAEKVVRHRLRDKAYPLFLQSKFYNFEAYSKNAKDSSFIGAITTKIPFNDILADSTNCRSFMEFLMNTYCSEKLYFWLDVEEYKRCPSVGLFRRQAAKIYNKYLTSKSKSEVEVPAELKKTIFDQLNDPSPTLFNEIQLYVYKLMESESYPSFLVSPQYQELIRKKDEKKTTVKSALQRRGLKRQSIVADMYHMTTKPLQTFNDILASPVGLEYFLQYLRKQEGDRGELYLKFHKKVEDLNVTPNSKYLLQQINKTYRSFFTGDKKIDFPEDVLKEVEEIKKTKIDEGTVERTIYAKAHKVVLERLEKDYFEQFKESSQFKALEIETKMSNNILLNGRKKLEVGGKPCLPVLKE